MQKAGLVPKIDPERVWAIYLDETLQQAMVGYPCGKGLDAAQWRDWGKDRRMRWVLEADLYLYYSRGSVVAENEFRW